LIAEITDPGKILLITSETSDEDKTRIFSDVNAEWCKYQVVIFTPTCSAGVSFTEKHFSALYGYFTDKSTAVESWRQSMYRARDIASCEYNICINAPGEAYELKDIDETKQYMRNTKHISYIDVASLEYTIDAAGEYEFKDNLLYEIISWGRFIKNRSRCKPIETFIEQCTVSGATMTVLESREDVEFRRKYLKLLAEIKAEEHKRIIDAPELTSEEFDHISGKETRTPDEKHMVDKFMLRNMYKWGGIVDMNFMETYAVAKTIKKYRNLKEILQYDSPGVSLVEIRKTIPEEKISPANGYIRHKIAIDLLKVCGFDSILDNKTISRADFLERIANRRADIEKQMGMICFVFSDKKSLKKWEIKQVLKFLNGIFDSMYGFKVCLISKSKKDRDKFVIKHSAYGAIFDKIPTESKPYIEPGWKQKIIEPPVEGFLEM
jgi:hypothetical protein